MTIWTGGLWEASKPNLVDILLEKYRAWSASRASNSQDLLPDDARRQLMAERNEASLARTWSAHSARRVF